jgi:hypothetical protein
MSRRFPRAPFSAAVAHLILVRPMTRVPTLALLAALATAALAAAQPVHTTEVFRLVLSSRQPFNATHDVRLISIGPDKRVVIQQHRTRFAARPGQRFCVTSGVFYCANFDLISVDVQRGRALLEGEERRYITQ